MDKTRSLKWFQSIKIIIYNTIIFSKLSMSRNHTIVNDQTNLEETDLSGGEHHSFDDMKTYD